MTPKHLRVNGDRLFIALVFQNNLITTIIDYQETIEWLFAQLPMFQRVGSSAYKKDLSNTILFAKHLGNPENDFKSIHIAGTNGKGSTSHMLASVLYEEGYKVGLYTSPHLKDFRERIKINGKLIPEKEVTSFVAQHKPFFENNNLSFFEMAVGLAFYYFSKEKVDVAIIEVGMGGRLDSTNIIDPLLSVITNIGMDHMQFLGNSLTEIASEKAGIIKNNIPVVIGESHPETQNVFERIASEKNAPIIFADTLNLPAYELDLLGNYQIKNQNTAVAAIQVLKQNQIFEISEEAIKNGLANVVKNTGLQGRWQVLQEKPKVICDTAHNMEGLTYVMKQLQQEEFKELHIVLGVVADKDLEAILPLFPKQATYHFCKPDIPRGMEVALLQETAHKFGLVGEVYPSVKKAYDTALSQAGKDDVVFVGGSTFVVAEII